MREFERIERICDKLKEEWKKCPDQRLGQFLINYIFGRTSDYRLTRHIFYQEDDITEGKFKVIKGIQKNMDYIIEDKLSELKEQVGKLNRNKHIQQRYINDLREVLHELFQRMGDNEDLSKLGYDLLAKLDSEKEGICKCGRTYKAHFIDDSYKTYEYLNDSKPKETINHPSHNKNKGKELFNKIEMLCNQYNALIVDYTQSLWNSGDFKIEIKIEKIKK